MKNKIIRGVEQLVNPVTAGTLHFFQQYNDMLPTSIQKKMVEKSGDVCPYMGFIVEPYGTFMFHKITDVQYFNNIIPSHFELYKCAPFKNEDEDYYMILSLFNARTSAFIGSRVEAYVIAKDKRTGLVSWIIIDYISNTISYDQKDGLSSPSVKSGFITTDFNGNMVAEMNDESHTTEVSVNMEKNAELKKLSFKLWVEGNISISYANKYSDAGEVFSLKFDEREMHQALDVPIHNINKYNNDWFEGYIQKRPSKIVIFKYAQHFLSDSPGHYSKIKSTQVLAKDVKQINFNEIEPYSTDKLVRKMNMVPVILTIIILILTILLILAVNI